MNFEYFTAHEHQIIWGVSIFVLSLVVSSLACIFVILRLPENYFHLERPPSEESNRPKWQRTLGIVVKNVVGVALVVLGLVMALPGVPGQGLLTMFMGIVLLDFPGKRAFERNIVSRPSILRACNRLRTRFGKKPFTLLAAKAPENDRAEPGTTNGKLEDWGQGRDKRPKAPNGDPEDSHGRTK
jgi:hypothetical protein